MAKAKKQAMTDNIVFEVVAFLFALGYMQSVLTVAGHVSQWTHNGTLHTVPAPSVIELVISLLILAYSFYKNRQFSPLIAISLTILATASLFWLSGLRTNFYY
ncbi:MAG TPA: hypothetical protein VFN56_01080 [Candidatus Saccharimonadales bacterium]|nr:hypothetical protein [Candidatus Saccharimonadales bacterium]